MSVVNDHGEREDLKTRGGERNEQAMKEGGRCDPVPREMGGERKRALYGKGQRLDKGREKNTG